MWSSPESPGAFGTPRRSGRPTRASSSSRSASAPTRSTRNFRRALPRAFRFSSESRKIAGHPGDHLGRLLGRDEDVHPAREAGMARKPAADAQVEAARAVLGDRARQRDVVDQPARAVLAAARDRDLVLAREVRVELVVEEVVVDRLGGGVAVDDLVMREAGERAADDVARDVAAGAGRRHPDALEPLEDLGDVLQPDPVDLEALAGRAVDHAAAEVLGDRGHRLGLSGAQLSLDDLDAHHEMPVAGCCARRGRTT